MMANQRIYLTETRSGRLNAVLETTESVVVKNIDEAVNRIVSNYPRVLWLSKPDGIAVGFQGENQFFFAQLPALRIRSSYEVIAGDKITPTWGMQDITKGGLAINPQVESEQLWKTPKCMSLWLICNAGSISNRGMDVWYLIASIVSTDHVPDEANNSNTAIEFRKLPVGNLYTDARMCLGSEFPEEMRRLTGTDYVPRLPNGRINSVLSFLSAVKTYIDDSLWNSDLNSDEQLTKSRQLFQWNLSDISCVEKTITEVRNNSWLTSGPFDECLLTLEQEKLR